MPSGAEVVAAVEEIIPPEPVINDDNCSTIIASGGSVGNGLYAVDLDNDDILQNVYCDMTTSGGGWMLVMKSTDTSFGYNDPVWTTTNTVNDNDAGKTEVAGALKSTTFNTYNSFSNIMMKMEKNGSINVASWGAINGYTMLEHVNNVAPGASDSMAGTTALRTMIYGYLADQGFVEYGYSVTEGVFQHKVRIGLLSDDLTSPGLFDTDTSAGMGLNIGSMSHPWYQPIAYSSGAITPSGQVGGNSFLFVR